MQNGFFFVLLAFSSLMGYYYKQVEQNGVKWREGGETMFYGTFTHTLDDKGRVIMPSKFREHLGMTFVMNRGFDKCIAVYTNDAWSRVIEETNAMSSVSSVVRKFKRQLFALASQSTLDKQGRVVVPAELRAQANLSEQVVFVGMGWYFEVWDKDEWERYNLPKEDDLTFEQLAESLDGFVL